MKAAARPRNVRGPFVASASPVDEPGSIVWPREFAQNLVRHIEAMDSLDELIVVVPFSAPARDVAETLRVMARLIERGVLRSPEPAPQPPRRRPPRLRLVSRRTRRPEAP